MRLGYTFISTDHELSCLIYEEALKAGFDANQGQSDDGYFVEILDCTLSQFAAILLAAGQQAADLQPS